MQYQFSAWGHPNIRAAHKTTLEFTKDKDVSLNGDCIVGVNVDFDVSELKKFIASCESGKVRIEIGTSDGRIKGVIEAELNPDFSDEKELVIRRSSFRSLKTFAINSNKAAFEIDKRLISFMRDSNSRLFVKIRNNFTTFDR